MNGALTATSPVRTSSTSRMIVTGPSLTSETAIEPRARPFGPGRRTCEAPRGKAEGPPRRAFPNAHLLHEILNLENLRLGGVLDTHVAENGHQRGAVRLPLLARIPYFADSEALVWPERDV